MSTTTALPATTPIPVQLSETEFDAFILPHLSMPKRGPKCKLGYYRVFNLILRVLYTGMQWKCLPIPQDTQGKPAIHYTTIYSDGGPVSQAVLDRLPGAGQCHAHGSVHPSQPHMVGWSDPELAPLRCRAHPGEHRRAGCTDGTAAHDV